MPGLSWQILNADDNPNNLPVVLICRNWTKPAGDQPRYRKKNDLFDAKVRD
jgi:hypothetical protein